MRLRPLYALAATLVLSGCASMAGVRADNRAKLVQLSPGMTRAQVLSIMGAATIQTFDPVSGLPTDKITNPYRNEFYEAGGRKWEILFYYTDIKASDGAITDDELTPLVFRDGILESWGWSSWNDVAAKYEIRVR